MSRRLYSSFQRSDHRQNESIKTAHTQTFQFCLIFVGFFSILLPDCSFVVGEDYPNMLLSLSDRKEIKSPTKKRAEVHKVPVVRQAVVRAVLAHRRNSDSISQSDFFN